MWVRHSVLLRQSDMRAKHQERLCRASQVSYITYL